MYDRRSIHSLIGRELYEKYLFFLEGCSRDLTKSYGRYLSDYSEEVGLIFRLTSRSFNELYDTIKRVPTMTCIGRGKIYVSSLQSNKVFYLRNPVDPN